MSTLRLSAARPSAMCFIMLAATGCSKTISPARADFDFLAKSSLLTGSRLVLDELTLLATGPSSLSLTLAGRIQGNGPGRRTFVPILLSSQPLAFVAPPVPAGHTNSEELVAFRLRGGDWGILVVTGPDSLTGTTGSTPLQRLSITTTLSDPRLGSGLDLLVPVVSTSRVRVNLVLPPGVGVAKPEVRVWGQGTSSIPLLQVSGFRGGDTLRYSAIGDVEKGFFDLSTIDLRRGFLARRSILDIYVVTLLLVLLVVGALYLLPRSSLFLRLRQMVRTNDAPKTPSERPLRLVMDVYLLIFLTTLLVLFFLRLTSLLGQVTPASSVIASESAPAADLRIESAIPADAAAPVALTLDFFALAGAATPDSALVEIETDPRTALLRDAHIEPPWHGRVAKVTQKGVTVKLPITSAPGTTILALLGDSAIGYSDIGLLAGFSRVAQVASRARLSITIAPTSARSADHGFIHPFPFDRQAYTIPLAFPTGALLASAAFDIPTGFRADGAIDPIRLRLVEHGRQLRSERDAPAAANGLSEQAVISPRQQIAIQVELFRPWLQRYGLTYGQFVFAILGGVLLGLLARAPQGSVLPALINGVGILGLPTVFYLAVDKRFPALPTLRDLGGTTRFELFFLVSFVVFAGVAITVARWKK